MYSSRELIERPRLSNRGYYSDLDHRSLYHRRQSHGYVEHGEESIDAELEANECVFLKFTNTTYNIFLYSLFLYNYI